MTSENVNVSDEELKKLLENIEEFINLGFQSKNAIYDFLRSRIPQQEDINLSPFPPKSGGLRLVDTGNLKNRYGLTIIKPPNSGEWSYAVGNTAPYALEVLKKTKIPFIGVSKPLIEILADEIGKNISTIVNS